MSKTTNVPVRVSAAQVTAAIAAYPAQPTGVPNIFDGRSGASKANVWDFCLVCWPESFWTESDIAAVYYGIHKRGITTADGSPLAFENAKRPDGTFALEFTGGRMLSGGHLREHCQMLKGKGYTDSKGVRHPRVKAIGPVGRGPWMLHPDFLVHCRKTGVNIGQGYPALPLKASAGKASAGKASAGKASAGKASAAKPSAAKSGATGKGSGKAVTPAPAPTLTAPPVTEIVRVTPADAIK